MAKQTINLVIAGQSYPFKIDSDKEELYRLAEREVNNYLTLIKKQNYKNWTEIQFLSMAALKFAIENLHMRQNREVVDDDLKRLEEIDSSLDDYLNSFR